MQYISKRPLDEQGRVNIPKAIREELNIQPGTHFRVRNTEQAIELYPIETYCVICGKQTNHKRNSVYICPECVAKLIN